MDILNWIYLKATNKIKKTFNNSATDLVVLGANVGFENRGDSYQSYGMTVNDFIAQSVPNILYSGSFYDTTTQNNGGATTANQVLINTTQNSTGFTLGGSNNIIVNNTSTYFFSLSLQLTFTGGASNYNVTVWYTIDNVNVPDSAFTFTTTGAQNDQTLAVVTDTIKINAGQSIKFYWWSQATGMKLLATAAGSSPTRPLSPSVNLSIFNVG
jgi:hypothetical protein